MSLFEAAGGGNDDVTLSDELTSAQVENESDDG